MNQATACERWLEFDPEAPDALDGFASRALSELSARGASFWRSVGHTVHLEQTWGISAAEAMEALPTTGPTDPRRGRNTLLLEVGRTLVGFFVFHGAETPQAIRGLRLPAKSLALALDHARLRRREEAIAERFDRLTNAMRIPMVFVDAGWRLLQINQAFRSAHGLEAAPDLETLDELWQRIVSQYAPGLAQHLADWRRSPLMGRVFEAEQLQPKEAHHRIVITPFPDERGGFEGGIIGFYDITQERRQLRLQADFIDSLEEQVSATNQDLVEKVRELARANQRLLELDQLKSDFISTMSHELRTPLNLIVGFASLLEEGITGQLPGDPLEWVRGVLAASEQLRRLIDSILDLSRLEAGRYPLYGTWLDPTTLVYQALDELKVHPEAEGKRLVAKLPDRLVEVWAAPEALYHHVLLNLVVNALKFTEPGGAIEVEVDVADSWWTLSVHDTGIGIPSEALDRIFERFYQVDSSSTRQHGGSGLGLAIAKEVVALHGGAIRVESQLGVGSRFTVTLPVAPESATPKEAACTS
jgi:signal transduction histidine kinase